jgi:hypothetical protein
MGFRNTPPPLWLLRIWLPLYQFGLGVRARLPGGRYSRFVILPDWCKRAVEHGESTRATALAQELLALAGGYPDDWNYGNALHHGHLTLGRVALAVGDLARARAELLEAGRTPGSPQLNSFGPNMRLACDLLAVGEREVVRQYFDLCRTFWELGNEFLDRWDRDVAEGRAPNFGPNLVY